MSSGSSQIDWLVSARAIARSTVLGPRWLPTRGWATRVRDGRGGAAGVAGDSASGTVDSGGAVSGSLGGAAWRGMAGGSVMIRGDVESMMTGREASTVMRRRRSQAGSAGPAW